MEFPESIVVSGGRMYPIDRKGILVLLVVGDIAWNDIVAALEGRGIHVDTNKHIVSRDSRKSYLLIEKIYPGIHFSRTPDGTLTIPLPLIPVAAKLISSRLRAYYFNYFIFSLRKILFLLLIISLALAPIGFFANVIEIIHISFIFTILGYVAILLVEKLAMKIPHHSLLAKGEEKDFPIAILTQNDSATIQRIMESIDIYVRTNDIWWLENGAWLSWAVSISSGMDAPLPPTRANPSEYVSYIATHGMEDVRDVPVFIGCPVCGTKIEMIPKALVMATGSDGLFKYVSEHGDHTVLVELDKDFHARNVTLAHGAEEMLKLRDVIERIKKLRRNLGGD